MQRIYESDAYGPAARDGCYWQAPKADWPVQIGEQRVETAIIGGGYTGLSAALHLAEAGEQVLVLEAQSPGWGASGRNGGFCCLGGAKLDGFTMKRRYGAAATAAYVESERAAVRLVAELLARLGIDAQTHSNGEIELAHRAGMEPQFNARAKALNAQGIKATVLSRDALEAQGMKGPQFHAGLHTEEGFALNPARYVAGLAQAAEAAGAQICARSPVTAIQRENGGYVLTTAKGRVLARKLVLATNGYSSEDLPEWLRARYLPVQSNILVTRILTQEERQTQGWDTDLMAYDSRHLLHYFRLLPDGRFLFGMRGGIRADARARDQMQQAIRRDFERMFPAWRKVDTPYFWSGLICTSRKRVPYVGAIGDWQNAWAGLAYHGNGVAMGTHVGKLLAGLVLGRNDVGKVFSAPLHRFPFGASRRGLLAPVFAFYNMLDGR